MFGLCLSVSSSKLARQISRKRAEFVQCEQAGDQQRLSELLVEIEALEDHMLAMRESGLA